MLPAEDTAMAQGAEQGSLEVTATSPPGTPRTGKAGRPAVVEERVQGLCRYSHSRPGSWSSRAIPSLLNSKDC